MSQEYGKFLTMALITKSNDKGTNLRGAAREAGISNDLASDWIRGKAVPTEKEIEKLCAYLECSVSDVKKIADAQAKRQGVSVDAPTGATKATEKVPTKNVETKKAEAPKEPEKVLVTKKEEFSMPEPIADTNESKELPKTKAPAETKTEKPAKATEEAKPKKVNTQKSVAATVTTEVKKRAVANKPKNALPEKKTLFNDETEAFIRKTAGLKKADEIKKEDIAGVFTSISWNIKEQLLELDRMEKSVTEALYATLAEDKVEDRLRKLVDAARNATDEGLDLAVTILEKFAK